MVLASESSKITKPTIIYNGFGIEIINNNKVQDYRIREKIEKRKLDLSRVDRFLDQQEAPSLLDLQDR